MQAIVTKSECKKWKRHESSRWTMEVAECKAGKQTQIVNETWKPKTLKQKFLTLIRVLKGHEFKFLIDTLYIFFPLGCVWFQVFEFIKVLGIMRWGRYPVLGGNTQRPIKYPPDTSIWTKTLVVRHIILGR
jgi:hypothetical protein